MTGVFARHDVSISSVFQDTGHTYSADRLVRRLTVTTHAASQEDLEATIEELNDSTFVAGVNHVIRVEES